VRAAALVRTSEPDALALRMRSHFAHKMPVEVEGALSRVRLPSGEFELEAHEGSIAVRASSPDEKGLARVREVVASHLARFARADEVAVVWDELERRTEALVGGERNGPHLLRTRDWAVELDPDASEALRLAALLHDVDRHAGDVPLADQVAAWDDPAAVAGHAARSARIAGEWLRAERAPEPLVEDVEALIRLHEVGGSPPADILQAADSLSFLELNPAARWVRDGLAWEDEAARKLRAMHDRIRVEAAKEAAAVLLERARAELPHRGGAIGPDRGGGIHDQAPAGRARVLATEGRTHGNRG
jgi:hypothetical protein